MKLANVEALLESEEAKMVLDENQDLLLEAADSVDWFGEVMKGFILEHLEEFLDKSPKDTMKNIRVFSEIATSQFLTEISARLGEQLLILSEAEETATKEGLKDFLQNEKVQRLVELSTKFLEKQMSKDEKQEMKNLLKDPFIKQYLAAAEQVGARYGWFIGGSTGLVGSLAAAFKIPAVAASPLSVVAVALLGAAIAGFLGSRVGKVIRRWMAENAVVSKKILPFWISGKASPLVQV